MRLARPTSKALWGGLAAFALVLPTGLAAQRLLVGESAARADEWHGVRLGMTASAVRAAVARELGPGGWATELGPEGLVRMDWTPQATPDPSAVRGATFELHEGVLVAIRARVTDAVHAPASPLLVSAGAVRRVEDLGPPGARITLIARSCPVHRDEVATLLASD